MMNMLIIIMVMMMENDFGSVPGQVLRVSQRLSPSCHLHWAHFQNVFVRVFVLKCLEWR